ncbi:MAG: hypothetical protein ACRDOI_40905, partial [Trebonia sp.]
PLHRELAAAAKAAMDLLWSCDADELLTRHEAELAGELVALASFEPPALARREACLEAPSEFTEPGERDGKPVQAIFTRYTLVVPVTGQTSLLQIEPHTWQTGYPLRCELDVQAATVRLDCAGLRDPGKLNAYFERALNRIDKRAAEIQAAVEGHNRHMARQLPEALAGRRAKLLEDRQIQARIGYRLQRRPDAGSYLPPVRRRTLAPRHHPPAGTPLSPSASDPFLDDAAYEAALAVLHHERNTLERNPSLTAKLNEEDIRNVLLMGLNTQFEGKAGGEAFNYSGRTDILIRERDRNVFIGECKIYDPAYKHSVERVIAHALTQLLGYLAWRDTKAALLLFIRHADVSAVTGKALTAIQSHPNCKRQGETSSEERHDFVFSAVGDESREIRLAFLPFLIGSVKP